LCLTDEADLLQQADAAIDEVLALAVEIEVLEGRGKQDGELAVELDGPASCGPSNPKG
jgi:hypothetical protein